MLYHDTHVVRTAGAVIVNEEAEYGDVDQDLQSTRRLRHPGVPRRPLGTSNCRYSGYQIGYKATFSSDK